MLDLSPGHVLVHGDDCYRLVAHSSRLQYDNEGPPALMPASIGRSLPSVLTTPCVPYVHTMASVPYGHPTAKSLHGWEEELSCSTSKHDIGRAPTVLLTSHAGSVPVNEEAMEDEELSRLLLGTHSSCSQACLNSALRSLAGGGWQHGGVTTSPGMEDGIDEEVRWQMQLSKECLLLLVHMWLLLAQPRGFSFCCFHF